MKTMRPIQKTVLILTLIGALAFIAIPLLLILPTTGCNSLGITKVEQGSDPFVVDAEQTAKIAFYMVDEFLMFERYAPGPLPEPLTNVADKLRDEFPQYYQTFRTATKAYKYSRNAENKATLVTAKAVLKMTIMEVMQWLPKAQQEKAERRAKGTPEMPVAVPF